MRKVLSFVLVLALVLSSFSMAFAADSAAASLTDIAGNANEDAIQVCFDLGIVTGNPDGTFLPEKAVTRAEFAAMLTRALDIPASALAGYTATSFKDTAGYSWAVPYLAFCQSKGILLGDGAGNVMPGKTITVNEAMTMALRAIGYTANSALLVGAWPSNYVSIAQNAGLYDDVAATSTVDKASAAQIIYNLLTVQKVSVNSDGTTDLLWVDGDEDGDALNLLNSNLGCESDDDTILGDDYGYDDAVINITGDFGAYGTAYLNDDDELVAFTKDSTALTGSVNDDGDFEVGDVTYEFGTNSYTTYAAFANTDDVTTTAGALTVAQIEAFAATYADDEDTVTLNVDLSGKKIKDIYSIVAWEVTDADLAASDVQDDIEDKDLLSGSFVETDDDTIDMNSFELVGVASLSDIAEDDVVYIYTDGDDIRKVAVGTETVEGTIEELNTAADVATVGGKDYDVAYLDGDVAYDFDDSDIDADGTFYLDAFGQIYDFDGTASVNTYGVVKAATAETSFDNYKIKLYTSDDATKTLYLSEEDPADIDWTTTASTTIGAVTPSATGNGGLIGYSLDSNGDVDSIDNTGAQFTSGDTFKSSKVVGGMSIDSACVVFTYDGTSANADTSSYDVATLGDIDAGTVIANGTYEAFYILNDDGDVAAMLISSTFANADNDDVYGVFNERKTTTTDGDPVYKFTGFIDGTAFTYKTTDDTNTESGATGSYGSLAGVFGVYAITTDANSEITKIAALGDVVLEDASGLLVDGSVDAAGEVTALGSDNTVFTIGGEKFVAEDDAVVYKFDDVDDEYTVSKLSAIDEGDTVMMYDTKGSDADGIATVVIFIAE